MSKEFQAFLTNGSMNDGFVIPDYIYDGIRRVAADSPAIRRVCASGVSGAIERFTPKGMSFMDVCPTQDITISFPVARGGMEAMVDPIDYFISEARRAAYSAESRWFLHGKKPFSGLLSLDRKRPGDRMLMLSRFLKLMLKALSQYRSTPSFLLWVQFITVAQCG